SISGHEHRCYFSRSVRSPSLTAAYAPAKKPMKLEPIVMIHGGSISDKTPMSTSRACRTAPPNVPPSQKTIQKTRMRVDCRASFIAAPKGSVPGYTLERDHACSPPAKMKNANALAVKREEEEDWSKERRKAAIAEQRRFSALLKLLRAGLT